MSEKTTNVTLRDEFAKAIIPALIATAANRNTSGDLIESGESLVEVARLHGWSAETTLHDEDRGPFTIAGFLASEAYELADALMRERGRPGSPVVPVGGESDAEDTPGHVLAHPVPAPRRSTPRSGSLCGAGCSDAAGLNSCHPQTSGVDKSTRPSDRLSDGLPPTKSE